MDEKQKLKQAYATPQMKQSDQPPPAYDTPVHTHEMLPAVTAAPLLFLQPTMVKCTACHNTSMTTISHRAGLYTWLISAGLVWFGCILCSWIPCVMSSTKDVVHYCSLCGSERGRYLRL